MSKNKVQKIIAILFASSLLIAAGCSNNMQKASNKPYTNDVVISPVVITAEKNEFSEINPTCDEPSDGLDTPESSLETTENIENSKTDTTTENSNTTTENKTSSDSGDSEKSDSQTISAPPKTTAQQETTQKPAVQQNNNTTTVKENTASNTQSNTASQTQTTTQNITKPSTDTPQKKEITSISLDKSKVTLDIGEKVKLNLTIYPSDVAHKAYTYSTSDNRVAGIDINGVITAKADGTALITVTTDNGKTAKCNVTVRKPDPTSVSITPNNLKLSMNEVYTLSASNNINSDSVKYSWSSSNTSCIKIISFNNRTIAVKAVGCGTAIVTVKTQNNLTATCRITVSKTDENVKEIVTIVNNERTNNGLAGLANRIDLNELADIRAKEIAEKFSHTRPDGSSCFTILDDNNVGYMSAGENIAYGQKSVAEVMNSWLKSSGHRANIFSSDFNCIGVGHYQSNGIDYWVQIFIGD
ncbi:MAG: CAP domain-containing protein [Acutalibacteraceae bacterium]